MSVHSTPQPGPTANGCSHELFFWGLQACRISSLAAAADQWVAVVGAGDPVAAELRRDCDRASVGVRVIRAEASGAEDQLPEGYSGGVDR